MSDGSSSFFGSIARLTSLGQLASIVAGMVIFIATGAIWTNSYFQKIDSYDKRIVALEAEISRLRSDYKSVGEQVADLASSRSDAGTVGPAGPPGPQGERGEKGEKGDKGDPGTVSSSEGTVSAALVAKLVQEQLAKLPQGAGGTTVTGLPMVAGDGDCILLKPTENKFRFQFKEGQKFCADDGEVILKVYQIGRSGEVGFGRPGSEGYWCNTGNQCQLHFLRNYSFHIEGVDELGNEKASNAIFKMKS